MKKFLIFMIITALGITTASGCVTTSTPTSKIYSDPAQDINVGKNEEFLIALDSPSKIVGFNWEIEYDDAMLKLVDNKFEWTDASKPEAGGTRLLRFEAMSTGETKLSMVYVRWWPDGDKAYRDLLDEKVFTVKIK